IPETIYIRLELDVCYQIFQFRLTIENCPPTIPQGFSPNDDSINDWFNIQGLYNIFTKHELIIYNRYGTLIFEGNNDKRWEGYSNRGINSGQKVPVGTYYYILRLNDPNYKPFIDWVYVNY
ncbi:MAG: gliding motility-associated C-terminal domain-containing protein, partial [Psychroserpens sp.]|nr:gliding motility-associated C-terminal domain-containing protein [Psychroserpens sp.]